MNVVERLRGYVEGFEGDGEDVKIELYPITVGEIRALLAVVEAAQEYVDANRDEIGAPNDLGLDPLARALAALEESA